MKNTVFLLIFISLVVPVFCQQVQSENPIYIRTDTSWKGFFPRKDQFVEYLLIAESKLQDPYHILVKPGLGLNINFAEKSNFESNLSLLEAHKKWEVDYWKSQVKNIKVKDCKDLYEGLSNILVTELEITRDNPPRTSNLCFISVSGKDGVYSFAFSPVSKNDHELIRRFIKSIKVIEKPFNVVEESLKLKFDANDTKSKKINNND